MPAHERFSSRRRDGFTIVELLVTIAIIAVLLGVLLPAVQAAREAARKTHCKNNLRQIGLAMHAYEACYRSLPWGAKGGWGPSWTTDILPYLEQPALAEIVPYGEAGYATGNQIESQRFRMLATAPVMTFRCPSQPGPISLAEPIGKIENRVLNSYLGNAGGDVEGNHYTSGGKIGMEAGNGVLKACNFCHVESVADKCDNRPDERPVTFADIRDGLSHTALVAETRYIDLAECGVCDHFMLYHTDFDDANGRDFSEALMSLHFGINLREVPKNHLQMSIGSYHPGGVHVLTCDGAVNFMSEFVEEDVRRALGSSNEHERVPQAAW